jgi:hypothetical protein
LYFCKIGSICGNICNTMTVILVDVLHGSRGEDWLYLVQPVLTCCFIVRNVIMTLVLHNIFQYSDIYKAFAQVNTKYEIRTKGNLGGRLKGIRSLGGWA